MTKNVRSALLALALATSIPAVATAAPLQSVQSAQAQSVVPATPSEPCDSATPGASGTNGCKSGVIRPPATGDKGVVMPPDTSQSMPMPVIPPPGTPGGNQSVQPK